MPPFADVIWAKLDYDSDKNVIAALPLVEHAFDVAAAFEALLAGGGWDAALTATAGRALTAQDWVRLIVLAALHDIGKVNWGFQARLHPGTQKIGHEGQVAALLYNLRLLKTPASQALWGMLRDWGATSYISALMAHHGRPREEFGPAPLSGGQNLTWEKHVNYWLPAAGYDPAAEALRLIEQVRARYPDAWEPGDKLPDARRFVALFAGLVTLADWLGSDTRRFPVEGPYGAEREAWRPTQAAATVAARGLVPLATPATNFATAFRFDPRGVQVEAAADDMGPVALIEAETGSGKTEAALWRWLELRRLGQVDGLYFALPTRTAAVQLFERVKRMLKDVWGEDAPEAVLAVPGYLQAGDATGQILSGYDVQWGDGNDHDSRWAAERTNRFLAARVAVGTIDQALLGALRVKHAPVRAAALARSLLVVDEVHASDAYMARLLEQLLDNHVAAGGRALLLSATLGGTARARLLKHPLPTLAEAEAQPYPALSGHALRPRQASSAGTPEKRVTIETAGIIEDADAIAARAIAAARAGASVLVIRNSVGGAVAVAQAVEALAPDLASRVNGVATLHHGRFAPSDRRLLDEGVEAAFGKGRTAAGRVLVGTQTLEQSLDIDADLLITDLAPMDVLLQRIGRLHRHPRKDRGAFAEATVVVLRPADRDLARLLGSVPDRHGLGPMADGAGVYPNLLQIEATLRLLETNPAVTIPADNRRLVEHALHPDVLAALAVELGTAWRNHAANRAASDYGDRQTGGAVGLNLDTPFRELHFPPEHVATRLGEQQLLVDFETPLAGPFKAPVKRIAIPHWMAGGVGPDDQPQLLGGDAEGERFALGPRHYAYGRWGLVKAV
ncbi:CRISPR-associated helicase Cas3' [uncultured Sphingomonas sp.]|uniref:CRISPR-associated helicase Cas3' n=1 Tax=uncultured Sphingomonas sp. TaxID=158754 RepID=UPI0035CA9BCF